MANGVTGSRSKRAKVRAHAGPPDAARLGRRFTRPVKAGQEIGSGRGRRASGLGVGRDPAAPGRAHDPAEKIPPENPRRWITAIQYAWRIAARPGVKEGMAVPG